MPETIIIRGDRQREYARQQIAVAPVGYVVKLAPETRRDRQNAKLWAMIADLQRQVPDMATFSADDIKNRFMHALGAEMRFLPELEGAGMFPCGLRSSKLTVAQFAGLIELLNAYGAKHDVQWSDPGDEGYSAWER